MEVRGSQHSLIINSVGSALTYHYPCEFMWFFMILGQKITQHWLDIRGLGDAVCEG